MDTRLLTTVQMIMLCHYSWQEVPLKCDVEGICSCNYVSHELIANCLRMSLTQFPRFYNNVAIIDLNMNRISSFEGVTNIPDNVTSLLLSDNDLLSFDHNPFRGMTSLISLDLSGNRLHYQPHVYYPDVFNDLVSLEYLNIKRNSVPDSTSITKYPVALTKLISLRELKLDGIEHAVFDENFRNLSSLSTLDLSGGILVGRYCWIRTIDQNFFLHLQHIKHLDLSWCKLRNIEIGSLMYLSQLQSLDLSFNIRLTFRALPNVTFDLQFTNITVLKINQLHCPSGIGTIIFADDVRHLAHTSLQELHVKYNRLQIIQMGVLFLLPKTLETLDLSFNDLNAGSYLFGFQTLTNLRNLIVGHRLVSPTKITKQISTFANCNDWRGPHKKIPNHTTNGSISLVFIGFIPPKAVEIDISYLNLRSSIETMRMAKNSLQRLDASGNSLHSWKGPVLNLNALTYFDLSHNECDFMNLSFFTHFPSLETLIIKKNYIGTYFSTDTEGKAFGNLGNLTYLDMSVIGLSVLPPKIFWALSRLQFLNVASNAIQEWNVVIRHMKNLKYLDLSENRLSFLNEKTRKEIELISQQSNLSINLKGNSLQCSCDTLTSLLWMTKHKQLFVHFHLYNCNFEKEIVTFSNINRIIVDLQMKCNNYIVLIFSVLTSVVFSIVIICAGILYRYRWKIRYLYYLAKKRYQDSSPQKNDENYEYEYDAFISYANEDRIFVEQHLLGHLEVHLGMMLCLHNRDFVPGIPIADNITNAIHSSRKTVIILSRHYLKSDWCNFEFNMARMEDLYSRNGESTLFVVLLERVPPRDIPLAMLTVMETDSYIEFPNDENVNDMFWNKFQTAISL